MSIKMSINTRYHSRWAGGYLEAFFDGKSIGKVRVSDLRVAKKLFRLAVETHIPLQDLVHFERISQEMVGADLSKMSYSEDRQQILYQGRFLADA